jgi:uncharacterized protein (TIGR02145 family)
MNWKELPPVLMQLKGLTGLDISDNRIVRLPASIQQLKQLKRLDLSNNGLKLYPKGINRLQQLSFLDMSNNPLERTPVFSPQLLALTKINLINNRLKAFPTSLLALSQLQHIELSHNPLSFPSSFATDNFTVEKLFLLRCDLTQFPKALLALKVLKNLDLGENKIVVLPEEAGQFEALTTLDVSQNELERIAPAIVFTKQLKLLDLSLNQLKRLPNISAWESLEELRVGFCFLKELPIGLAELDDLKIADFKYNQLEEAIWMKKIVKCQLITVGNPLSREKKLLKERLEASRNTVTDPRDAQVYGTITINEKTWMTQHLNYQTATSIPDTLRFNNGQKYTHKEYNHVCPVGWHTATEEDWRHLLVLVNQYFEQDPNGYQNRTTASERVPYEKNHKDLTVTFDPSEADKLGDIGAMFLYRNQAYCLYKKPAVNFLGLDIKVQMPRKLPSFMHIKFPFLNEQQQWNFFHLTCHSNKCPSMITETDATEFEQGYLLRCVKD